MITLFTSRMALSIGFLWLIESSFDYLLLIFELYRSVGVNFHPIAHQKNEVNVNLSSCYLDSVNRINRADRNG